MALNLVVKPGADTRLRQAVRGQFTPSRIASLRPCVEKVASGLLDELVPAGKADLVEDFATPLAITMLVRLLGVPEIDHENFRFWADRVTDDQQVHDEARGYLHDLVEFKREREDEDLISVLAREEQLTDDELVSLGFLLISVDYPATVDLMRNRMRALLSDPGHERVDDLDFLGAPLARLVTRIALQMLLERCPDVTAGESTGPRSLPVTFG